MGFPRCAFLTFLPLDSCFIYLLVGPDPPPSYRKTHTRIPGELTKLTPQCPKIGSWSSYLPKVGIDCDPQTAFPGDIHRPLHPSPARRGRVPFVPIFLPSYLRTFRSLDVRKWRSSYLPTFIPVAATGDPGVRRSYLSTFLRSHGRTFLKCSALTRIGADSMVPSRGE